VAKLPYFPLDPVEYLLDEKIESLELEEEGALLRLWCYMWVNKIKRGHLFYSPKIPISDEQIAKRLRISPERWQKIKEKFVDIKLIRIGKFGEYYSRRQSKYKTKYELYDKEDYEIRKKFRKDSENIQKHSENIQNGIRIRIKGEGKGKECLDELEVKRSKDTLVELWNSTCVDLPKVKFLSNSREKKIKDRLKEHPEIEFWTEVFEKCQNTAFLRGENKSGWKVTFNWLFLNDNNALKVIEGNYEKERFAGIKQWLIEAKKEAMEEGNE